MFSKGIVSGIQRIVVPDAPTVTSVEPDGNGALLISFTHGWDGGSPVTSTQFSHTGGDTFQYSRSDGGTAPFRMIGLTNGTTYNIVMRVLNAAGWSNVSNTISAYPYIAPGSPTNASATPGNQSITVSFSPPTSDGGSTITNYDYTLNNGTSYTVRSPASVASPLVISGLTNGTQYSVRIRAINEAGPGAVAPSGLNPFFVTPRTTASAPTVDPLTVEPGTIRVPWTAPSSNGGSAITGYQYSVNSGAWQAVPIQDNMLAPGYGQAANPFAINQLNTNTTYSIRMRAVNDAGTGAISNTRSGTTTGQRFVGGNVSRAGTDWVHRFMASGVLDKRVPGNIACRVLLIGGGALGNGAGAGAFVHYTSLTITQSGYVTIGNANSFFGTPQSVIDWNSGTSTVVAQNGGVGGTSNASNNCNTAPGTNGGCGGGGHGSGSTWGTSTGYGQRGGAGAGPRGTYDPDGKYGPTCTGAEAYRGGGGGTTGVGQSASTSAHGNGGAGTSTDIMGVTQNYCAGAAGGSGAANGSLWVSAAQRGMGNSDNLGTVIIRYPN